jgi:hypothetical protein
MPAKILKSKTIKNHKPKLKLKPNHFHYISSANRRIWPASFGTARRDGSGWYTR